jgi:signal transduction histidine kinase/CheY-like chemotaxis protein
MDDTAASLETLEVPEKIDLFSLVIHQNAILAETRLDVAYETFSKSQCESLAVVFQGNVIGLCTRKHVAFLLGSRFGFAVQGKKLVKQELIPNPLILVRHEPIFGVLQKISSRDDSRFYEDVILLDTDQSYLGIISVQRLVLLQEKVLRHNLIQLEASQRALTNKEKASLVQSLVCGLAHELNNKLSPVMSLSQWMINEAPPAEPDQKIVVTLDEIRIIHESTEEAVKIVHQLQNLSKNTRGEPKITNLCHLVKDVETLMRHQIKDQGIVFKIVSEVDEVYSMIDPSQLKQVLINLLINGIHALQKSQRKELILGIRTEDPDIIHFVSDTGCGISPEVQSRIFDPFFTTKSPQEGTGLGLSISLGIIQSQEGTILCKSRVGVGTRFEIKLKGVDSPVKKGEENPPDPHTRAIPSNGIPPKKMLIVDDEKEIRHVLSSLLSRRLGWDIQQACDGEKALKMLENDNFDWVISDVRMPVMNGIELLHWIENFKPLIRDHFLFMTGESPHSELAQQIKSYFIPVIHKPFQVDYILSLIHEKLEDDRKRLRMDQKVHA